MEKRRIFKLGGAVNRMTRYGKTPACKQPLIVIVAPRKLHTERQIVVEDSKYVIVFDPGAHVT